MRTLMHRFRHFTMVFGMLAALGMMAVPAAPVGASGLLVPTDSSLPPLRIEDHLVSTRIHNQVALTTLTQTFRNDSERRLEGTYIFPLPENADLTDFQMSFNGKMVEGEVLPADEARQIYESIVAQSRDPGLIEFIGRRLLRMRVFPIEPKSTTTIQVSYQQVCRPISGMRGYHYPLKTSATDGRAFGTVRFELELETSEALKNIWSPTHTVEIVREGEKNAKVAYESKGGSLEQDFLLLYATDDRDLGLSVVSFKPDEKKPGHFLMVLTPKQLWPEETIEPQDVVFVIDTSGSMAGEKLEQARKALTYCLTQLKDHDRFSIVRFSTGVDLFRDELIAANDEAKREAAQFVNGFNAQGGTNISDALVKALDLRDDEPKDARPFVVVFLTDGQGNRQPPEIMKTLAGVAGDAASLRIFPFGVGHDVNTHLLDGLSSEYHGRPSYVQPGEDLELVLGDFFSIIRRPVLTQLELSLPEIGSTERFPVRLGDLYHGQQLIVAGQFAKNATGPVKLTAKRHGQIVEYSWPAIAFGHEASADYVPAVWAGRKIAFLLDEIRAHGEKPEMIEEVVTLSQQYGIQTPYTSWLVAPERDRRGQPALAFHSRAGERLRQIAPNETRAPARPSSPPGGGGGGNTFGGGGFGGGGGGNVFDAAGDEDGITMEEAERAMNEASGKAATVVARLRADLRRLESLDEARLDENRLAVRTIKGRTYHRFGRVLADAEIGEKTEFLMVKFASPAWFELVRLRPELKAALAASREVAVLIRKDLAVLVLDPPAPAEGEAGENDEETKEAFISEFTEKQREQVAPPKR